MDACPVCKARYRNKTVCHRCKTDLKQFLDIEAAAEQLLASAFGQYHSGDYSEMFQSARRSYSLMKTNESRRVFACAALLTGDFRLAVDLMG